MDVGHPPAPAGRKVRDAESRDRKVEWDTEFSQMSLGGATVSDDLVFTMLYDGALVALNRDTGLVYGYALPTSADSTIAIAEHRPRARRGTQNGLGRWPTTVGRLRHPLRLQDQVMRLHIAHWGFTMDVRKSRNVLGSTRNDRSTQGFGYVEGVAVVFSGTATPRIGRGRRDCPWQG